MKSGHEIIESRGTQLREKENKTKKSCILVQEKQKQVKVPPKVMLGLWDLSPFSLALFSKFSLCFYNGRKCCVMLLDHVVHRERDTQRQAVSEMRER